MISRNHRVGAAAAAVATLACAPFTAQAAGFYMDAGVGYSSIGGFDQSELDDLMIEIGQDTFATFVLNDSSVDKNDIGYSFALGYQFSANFAVEAAYLQVGKAGYEADVTVSDGGPMVDLTMGFAFKSSGPALSVVGIWPVGDSLSLDARAGAYFSKTKASVFATDGNTSDSQSLGSEKDTSMLLGVGATWSLSDRLGLRLGYTRLDQAIAGEGDASTFSLSLKLMF